jgi:hypothetical protein
LLGILVTDATALHNDDFDEFCKTRSEETVNNERSLELGPDCADHLKIIMSRERGLQFIYNKQSFKL